MLRADHERAANARKIGREAFGDAIDEILLLRIAADVGEGQDDDREARRRGFFSAGGAGFAGRARRPQRIDADRLGDVLESVSRDR